MNNPIDPLAAMLISDRHAYVGNICHQWANIEYQLVLAIWAMLGIDQETGIILTGGVPIRARADMAVKLAKHLKAPEPALQTFKWIQKELESGIEDRRNLAVHGVRTANDSDSASEFFEMHRGRSKGRNIQTNDDLLTLSKEISALGSRLHTELFSSGIFNLPQIKPAAAMALKIAQTRSAAFSQPGS